MNLVLSLVGGILILAVLGCVVYLLQSELQAPPAKVAATRSTPSTSLMVGRRSKASPVATATGKESRQRKKPQPQVARKAPVVAADEESSEEEAPAPKPDPIDAVFGGHMPARVVKMTEAMRNDREWTRVATPAEIQERTQRHQTQAARKIEQIKEEDAQQRRLEKNRRRRQAKKENERLARETERNMR